MPHPADLVLAVWGIPSPGNFLGRAVAVVKSSIMHPLETTVIEESEDGVTTRTFRGRLDGQEASSGDRVGTSVEFNRWHE